MRKQKVYRDNRDTLQKVSVSFKQLRKSGIYTRMNFWDCQSCGYAAMDGELKKEAEKGRKYTGCAFYHNQDNDMFKETGELMIAFSDVDENFDSTGEEKQRAVGEKISDILRQNGLKAEWDGETSHRIKVMSA